MELFVHVAPSNIVIVSIVLNERKFLSPSANVPFNETLIESLNVYLNAPAQWESNWRGLLTPNDFEWLEMTPYLEIMTQTSFHGLNWDNIYLVVWSYPYDGIQSILKLSWLTLNDFEWYDMTPYCWIITKAFIYELI